MGVSKKSIYNPSNPKKYKGNASNIICRSNWERRFCKWCDLSESILEWGSEEFFIPYLSPIDKRVHRYFPDFIIKVKESTGQIKTYVIEVKPKKQTKKPTSKSSLFECKTYAINQAKWNAAREWCADRLIEFKIITEDELGINYGKKG